MNRTDVIKLFDSKKYSELRVLFDNYISVLTADGYPERIETSAVEDYPEKKDSLIVFEVRCNEEISFNNEIRNNDLLFVVEVTDDERSIVLHKFDCTTDPLGKKHNIAHCARQIYKGNIGLHRGVAGRECIRSDFGFGTFVRRTDTKGDVIYSTRNGQHISAIAGHYGINIHDNGGYTNSSLGCTILASLKIYHEEFRPLLLKCSNKNNVPVSMINIEDMEDIINGSRAESVSGKDNQSSGPEAKHALSGDEGKGGDI